MSGAREEVLAAVRAALGDGGAVAEAGPPANAYRVDSELDVEQRRRLFAERVAAYRARVHEVEPAAAAAAIGAALAANEARTVAVPVDLPASWRPKAVELLADEPALTPQRLDSVDGVVTGSALAIAETGTIVLDGGATQGRRALSLVPDLHVCVVAASRIRGTVPEAFAELAADRRRRGPLTFVSGPSATSDIELDRVEGVHGPRRLEVILLADA